MAAVHPRADFWHEGGADAGAAPLSAAATVRSFLSAPDEELDYARAKLAFDRLIDPSADVTPQLAELDALTAEALRLAGPDPTDMNKLGALRHLLYEAGPWNGNRPFGYDHSDPLGQELRNKLLPVYLATRLGNCVSMPILFLILGDRLGLNLALVSAPLHIFVRYQGAEGPLINIDATSGGHPARDEWYLQHFPMSEKALANGLYMRSLSRREGVALIATTVVEHLMQERRFEEAIPVAEIILAHHPRESLTRVNLASAFGGLMRRDFEEKYPCPSLIPPHLRSRYLMLANRNRSTMEAAEALGWEP